MDAKGCPKSGCISRGTEETIAILWVFSYNRVERSIDYLAKGGFTMGYNKGEEWIKQVKNGGPQELSLEELESVSGGVITAEAEGTVVACLPNAMFQVDIGGGQIVTANISGQLRMNYVRIQLGNRVLVEYFPEELRGRITWRYK